MLDAFNGGLTKGSNGMLTLGDSQFSTTYFKILSAASYQYSDQDNKVVQDPNIQSQQISVANEATSSGYAAQFGLQNPTYFSVIKSVLKEFGGANAQALTTANIAAAAGQLGNAGFASLQASISNALNQLAPLNAILNTQNQTAQELAAAQTNTQSPSLANGGLPIGNNNFYVGWTPLPDNNQIQGGLESKSSVSINIAASNFSSTQSNLSIDGKTGFTVPILDIVEIGVSASASYDLSKYTSSSSNLDMTLTYTGVSMVEIDPQPLSADYKTGWYDETLLQSIVKGSGDSSVSGFKIPTSSQFNISDTFGKGKTFSRFRTLVISKAPTISMKFSAADASKITSDFKENSSVSVKLFGLFKIGSVDQSYQIKKVDSDSTSGTVTVTLAPPEIKGTVPLNKQVCYVLGGVANYPPF
jgi:hypothetical protein